MRSDIYLIAVQKYGDILQ